MVKSFKRTMENMQCAIISNMGHHSVVEVTFLFVTKRIKYLIPMQISITHTKTTNIILGTYNYGRDFVGIKGHTIF